MNKKTDYELIDRIMAKVKREENLRKRNVIVLDDFKYHKTKEGIQIKLKEEY